MTTLSVAQLFDNDAPKTAAQSLATNTWLSLWAAPGASNRIRVRQIEISGAFAADDLIEIGEGTTAKLNYRWQAGVIVVTFPGEGWAMTANTALQIRHQNGAGVNVAVNVWGREEAV